MVVSQPLLWNVDKKSVQVGVTRSEGGRQREPLPWGWGNKKAGAAASFCIHHAQYTRTQMEPGIEGFH